MLSLVFLIIRGEMSPCQRFSREKRDLPADFIDCAKSGGLIKTAFVQFSIGAQLFSWRVQTGQTRPPPSPRAARGGFLGRSPAAPSPFKQGAEPSAAGESPLW